MLALLGITAVALLVRTINLTSLPVGFHGDEAVVGLEAQRILRDGWIGPWSPGAHGQPAGPIYLAAITVGLLGNTILAVRILPALLGTITVALLFVVLRREFGFHVAVAAAGLFALMGWHIHYSRIGFPLVSWPLVVVLIAGALAVAARGGHRGWWLVAGALTGAGIHTYNAHPLIIGIVGLFIVVHLLRERRRIPRETVRALGGFGFAMLLAMLPMIWFVARNPAQYAYRFERTSVLEDSEWAALSGPVEQAGYIAAEYFGFWRRLCCEPVVDTIDASGVTPTVPLALLVLAGVGMVAALLCYRSPLVDFGILIVLITPFGITLMTDAVMRRTLVMAPFLAMFAAIALLEIVRLARRATPRPLFGVTLVTCAALAAVIVVQDLRNYFVVFPGAPEHRWVFVEDFIDATHYMRVLPEDAYVYFYSDRWSIDYEPRRYLAPEVAGEDRSERFGGGVARFDVDPAHERPVFVLVGLYRDELERIRERHPGGRVVYGGDGERVTFIAYELW
jgi:4-amino-4-deoxy-L-arabinose transferase-like glycosyltransferase